MQRGSVTHVVLRCLENEPKATSTIAMQTRLNERAVKAAMGNLVRKELVFKPNGSNLYRLTGEGVETLHALSAEELPLDLAEKTERAIEQSEDVPNPFGFQGDFVD